MKKLALTFAIVLGMAMTTFAQGGGIFGMGETRGESYSTRADGDGPMIALPGQHGLDGDQGATPVGSGLAVLIGFGAAYALKKRNEK